MLPHDSGDVCDENLANRIEIFNFSGFPIGKRLKFCIIGSAAAVAQW